MHLSSNKQLVEHLKTTFVLSLPEVEKAFLETDRKNFVLPQLRKHAYYDAPLPTLRGQTISAPGVVAVMTEALSVREGMNVLEVGAGSGYQAAILARLVGKKGKVFSMERVPELAEMARENLERDGVKNALVQCGDGSKGLREQAPFERIIVTAAARKLPQKLFEQLKEGGRMVAPVGQSPFSQELLAIKKRQGRLLKEKILDVVFVPLVDTS